MLDKESLKKVSKSFDENEISLVLLKKKEHEDVMDVFSTIAKKSGVMCYITSRKESEIRGKFDEKGIDSSKIGIKKMPKNSQEIKAAAKECATQGVELVFFDNPKVFGLKNRKGEITKIVHNIISQMRILGVKGVFIIFEENMDKELLNDICMFIDKVIEI